MFMNRRYLKMIRTMAVKMWKLLESTFEDGILSAEYLNTCGEEGNMNNTMDFSSSEETRHLLVH